jgi:hypothetical protein
MGVLLYFPPGDGKAISWFPQGYTEMYARATRGKTFSLAINCVLNEKGTNIANT